MENYSFSTSKNINDLILSLPENCPPLFISQYLTWSESIVFMKAFKLLKNALKSKRNKCTLKLLKSLVSNYNYETLLDTIYKENKLAKYYSIYIYLTFIMDIYFL